ncbi:MAG: chorismate mutase [Gemmatimonadales bacterium]
MPVRGIRGATVVRKDTREEVMRATRELLQAIVSANDVNVEDVASVIFTVTPDIRSEYPARAARDLGWTDAALLGATEMDVRGGLPRCIRVLLHVNTDRSPHQMKHIYLHEARTLRPEKR